MTDPTAAERARRYRARRRERDAGVTLRADADAILADVLAELRALRAALEGTGYPPVAPTVGNRDASARHALERDATERHAEEGAPAPARVGARLESPTGSLEPPVDRNGVTPAAIVELLEGLNDPASVGAIGDALRVPGAAVAAALVALQRVGRVERIAATLPGERDAWRLVTERGETIRCTAYREHAVAGHRRDPVTGRFRCYVCEPEYRATSDDYAAAAPAS